MGNSSDREQRVWFRVLFEWEASVIPAITPKILLCGGFSIIIVLLDSFTVNLSLPLESGIVPSLVLGLLLVFRTNTAYDKFWEGRKAWGTLINTVRNLARIIWVSIEEHEPEDRSKKVATLRLLVAFAIATKLHLRAESVNHELAPFMPHQRYEKLKKMNNPPLEIAFWIGDYLQQQFEKGYINAYQLTAMFKLVDGLVDVLGICERILKTPIPLAYNIHLKQLILLYCLTLPFQLVDQFQWLTPLLVCLISFTVFGIEEIGIEIENPFGKDPNDLPLEQICQTMKINIEDLITLAPCVRRWKDLPNNLIEPNLDSYHN